MDSIVKVIRTVMMMVVVWYYEMPIRIEMMETVMMKMSAADVNAESMIDMMTVVAVMIVVMAVVAMMIVVMAVVAVIVVVPIADMNAKADLRLRSRRRPKQNRADNRNKDHPRSHFNTSPRYVESASSLGYPPRFHVA
jgi:hypothetical protein